jgi:membrane protein
VADADDDGDDGAPDPDSESAADPAADPSAQLSAIRNAAVMGGRLIALPGRVRRWVEVVIPQTPEYHPTRPRRVWLYTVYIMRRWLVEDGAGGMAAMLTLHTLLSTIPSIGIALMFVARLDMDSRDTFLREFFRSLVPQNDRADQLASGAMELAHNVSVSNLGTWGFVATIFIAFALYSTLERTFNRIWRVLRRRNLLVKFTMFYTLATLGPALLIYSLAQPYISGVAQVASIPALLTAGGLVLLNRYMPNLYVAWVPALAGGLVSAVLLEIGKFGFGYYATRFALQTYEGVYGPLAMLPILVVWSYLSWMVILFGAELTFVVQRRRAIGRQGFVNRYIRERTEVGMDSGRTAARLLLAVCDHYSRHGAETPTTLLADRFRLSVDRVGELLHELERHGFVIETEGEDDAWVPARPLEQMRVVAVLELFEREAAALPRADRLGEIFADLDTTRANVVGTLTFSDLVAHGRSTPADEEVDSLSR